MRKILTTGAIEIEGEHGKFMVNGHRLKPYLVNEELIGTKEGLNLNEDPNQEN